MLKESDELDFGHADFFPKPGLSFLDSSREGRRLLSDRNALL